LADSASECSLLSAALQSGLTASDKSADEVPKAIDADQLPPYTPRDFGEVMDRVWAAAQNELATLVPGAVHTNTHSPQHHDRERAGRHPVDPPSGRRRPSRSQLVDTVWPTTPARDHVHKRSGSRVVASAPVVQSRSGRIH
jgi:hypothetical protein